MTEDEEEQYDDYVKMGEVTTMNNTLRCPICGQFKTRTDVSHYENEHTIEEVREALKLMCQE